MKPMPDGQRLADRKEVVQNRGNHENIRRNQKST